MALTRRRMLALGGAVLATAARPPIARAQAPRKGGTVQLRLYDPPHFDHMLIISFKTHIALTFSHSRLVKHTDGTGATPGTFPLEGDLAESWTQPNETTYVF